MCEADGGRSLAVARWREHSAGRGWIWQAEKWLLAPQNTAPSPPNAKAIALNGFGIAVFGMEARGCSLLPDPKGS